MTRATFALALLACLIALLGFWWLGSDAGHAFLETWEAAGHAPMGVCPTCGGER